MNKSKHYHKIADLCEIAGFTKQAHSSYVKRRCQHAELYDIVHGLVLTTREFHPAMGLKKMYYLYEPDRIGRDRFLEIACELGLALPKPKNYQRTTFSYKGAKYKNLAASVNINDINLVWVSDITYFRVKEIFYYITFIMDVYSRRILGYCAANNMRAEESCKALNMAIKERNGTNLARLIHHSDKGSQYISDAYTGILDQHKIGISMCESVYENTHIERVNGIIKNEYLLHRKISSYSELCKRLDEDVYLYNNVRPHWSLECKTPVEFEKFLTSVPIEQRNIVNLFSDNELSHAQKFANPRLFT
jgi:transposase InsO family protein